MKKIYVLLIVLCFFTTSKAQIVNIPDANFKAKLLTASTNNTIAKDLVGNYFKIDANSDGQIQESEVFQVASLFVSNSNILDLTGIEFFTNLEYLNCTGNQLTSLNLNGLNKLIELGCSFNRLTTLDASLLINLQKLGCNSNPLTTLNVNGCFNLKYLGCGASQLTTLNIEGFSKLETLDCANSKLETLYTDGLINIKNIYCTNNQLKVLNLKGQKNLLGVQCNNNQITSLDLSDSPLLNDLRCSNNKLTSLNIKNGSNLNLGSLYICNNLSLNYICADNIDLYGINDQFKTCGIINCVVNSYCSFSPGGIFYTIQGKNIYDLNNNGCDVLDLGFPNLKYKITNNTNIADIIYSGSGIYSIPLEIGVHTITPVFENPTYFNVSPTNITVDFPTQSSPQLQNFCITPNGSHLDLEIILLPLGRARPGFDAKYKIVYKNKGNQTQSGSVNLNFNDAVLDFIVANPVTTTQTTNNLSWNFTDLMPFETREILLTLNLNSPMEIPSVNIGDVLSYITTITDSTIDENPLDNTFNFNQTVVNSYDPNDKTCLEGSTVSPSLIGQYVHYMIRFENTGTFPAENIVVKDMIDLAKFDISTLVPTNASHSFITNISASNKVEFIFENINLPFDDANNDGFIAFKIKTKSTLVVGNSFTNDASIYFDYNFPIVTNKATSTFKTLGTQDFEFSNYFTLYPNPAKSVLNISSKEGIEVKSISIYNTLGQLVLVVTNAEKVSKIDVSSLTTGNYFIKINSDKGTSNTKFIKV